MQKYIKLFDVLSNIGFDGNVKVSNFLGSDSFYNEKLDVSLKGDLVVGVKTTTIFQMVDFLFSSGKSLLGSLLQQRGIRTSNIVSGLLEPGGASLVLKWGQV